MAHPREFSPQPSRVPSTRRFSHERIPYTRDCVVYMVQYTLIYSKLEMGVINVNG